MIRYRPTMRPPARYRQQPPSVVSLASQLIICWTVQETNSLRSRLAENNVQSFMKIGNNGCEADVSQILQSMRAVSLDEPRRPRAKMFRRTGNATACPPPRERTKLSVSNSSKKSWCMQVGCSRRALYVFTANASVDADPTLKRYCALHRPSGSIADKRPSQRCQFQSVNGEGVSFEPCRRWPSYGDPIERLPKFCRAHSPPGYINLKARLCLGSPGHSCTRQASFGDPRDGKACPPVISRIPIHPHSHFVQSL